MPWVEVIFVCTLTFQLLLTIRLASELPIMRLGTKIPPNAAANNIGSNSFPALPTPHASQRQARLKAFFASL